MKILVPGHQYDQTKNLIERVSTLESAFAGLCKAAEDSGNYHLLESSALDAWLKRFRNKLPEGRYVCRLDEQQCREEHCYPPTCKEATFVAVRASECEFCEIDGYGNHASRCPVQIEAERDAARAKLNGVESARREAMVLLTHLWDYVDSLDDGPSLGQDRTTWLVADHQQLKLRLKAVVDAATSRKKL